MTKLSLIDAVKGRQRKVGAGAVLKFISATGGGKNLQDQVSLLGDQVEEALLEREVSLCLLRHLATSVRHQQYRGADIMTVSVAAVQTDDGRPQ